MFKQPGVDDPDLLENGAIAQLGERLHGMQEVGGSIPPGSTILPSLEDHFSMIMSPSSRGLGHCPFTAATGVRIPLGTPYASSSRHSVTAAFLFVARFPGRKPFTGLIAD